MTHPSPLTPSKRERLEAGRASEQPAGTLALAFDSPTNSQIDAHTGSGEVSP